MFVNSFLDMNAKLLLPAGLVAAFALDFAIFGGAHSALVASNKWFIGMVLGSSVLTGSLMATANSKVGRYAYGTAAVGLSLAAAYLAVADNDFLRSIWTKNFTHMDGDYNTVSSQFEVANDHKGILERQVTDLDQQVKHGGTNGGHVMTDGNPHNDYLVGDLKKAQDALAVDASKVASLKEQMKALGVNRPSQMLGLILGTGYLGTWLSLAQLQVASIIEKGPQWLKDARKEAADKVTQRAFVRAIEQNPDRVETKAAQTVLRLKELYLSALEVAGVSEKDQPFFADDKEKEMITAVATKFTQGIKLISTRPSFSERFGGVAEHLRLEPVKATA